MSEPSTYMSSTDASGTNNSKRPTTRYRDLDLFFVSKKETKDVNIITDIIAVKRSVRNLILMNHYEKPFHPEIGSGVRDILFENMSPISSFVLSKKIEDVIENFEPRAQLIGVRVNPNLDKNAYEVTVEFFVVNAPTEVVTQDLILEAIR
jgi:phage baseplate assembly protein W